MLLFGKAKRVRFRRNYSRSTYNTFIAPLLEKEIKVWRVGKDSISFTKSGNLVRLTVQPRGWY